jgi:Na+(H+)/acetate symporter ActP
MDKEYKYTIAEWYTLIVSIVGIAMLSLGVVTKFMDLFVTGFALAISAGIPFVIMIMFFHESK